MDAENNVNLLENEIRSAIHALTIALIKGGNSKEKMLRSLRSQLYKDLALIESSRFCLGGPLSLCIFRDLTF